ncbi:MAG: carbohydrate ABC transporter permease [Thermomicrobiales bacterium]
MEAASPEPSTTQPSHFAFDRRFDLSPVILTGILSLGAVATMAPFVWMVLTSLKPEREVLRLPITFWPENFSVESYRTIFEQMPIERFLLNSVIVAFLSIIPALFFGALAGYAFAKLAFKGREICFFFVIAVLMIPFEAKLIPLYLLFAEAGLSNTYLGLAGPGMFSAIGVFMMRQFMAQLPDDYLDAARIDGASELGVFWRIAVPLMRPAIFTLAIINFISAWNSFLWPLVMAQTADRQTITVGLATLGNDLYVVFSQLTAASLITVAPIIIVYVLLQRHVMQAMVGTGLKG